MPAFHAGPTLFSQPLGERLLCATWHDTTMTMTMTGMLGAGLPRHPGKSRNHTRGHDRTGRPDLPIAGSLRHGRGPYAQPAKASTCGGRPICRTVWSRKCAGPTCSCRVILIEDESNLGGSNGSRCRQVRTAGFGQFQGLKSKLPPSPPGYPGLADTAGPA